MRERIWNWLHKHLGGHITIRWFGWNLTIYGFNATHVAANFRTRRWGWVCFHPPIIFLNRHWPWKFYVSPNGTPGCATFAIGPGLGRREKRNAKIRRIILGHNYRVDDYDYGELLNIETMVDGWPGLAEI